MERKASVGIAIIAKDAEKTIGACLDSIIPYVEQTIVCVDELTQDNTAQIAKEHGASIIEGLEVSTWHECPQHGRVRAQHFAKAREESFKHLNPNLAWHGWLDTDDVLQGGEKLHQYLSSLPAHIAGVWFPYNYAQVSPGGPSSTMFDRERLVRPAIGWAWQHRVHELLVPKNGRTEQLNWARTDMIQVVHQSEGHSTEGSARRNILLLEIDLEENPKDMRAWFYLGNQYFALQDWGMAAECYYRSTESNNPYQLWQAYIYLSMCYEKMGDVDKLIGYAFHAIDIQPSHPEPYYRLAHGYMIKGDVGKCEYWTSYADQLPDPPAFVFRNPLDRAYNSKLTLATAYANVGLTSRARQQLELAAKAVPNKMVLEGIEFQRKLEADAQIADAYTIVMRNGAFSYAETFPDSLPEGIWRFGRVRDVAVPKIINGRNHRYNTQPRIVFFCGRSVEPWATPSLDTTGIGGSETAVIEIAKRFSRDGWKVDVYNDPDHLEGVYDGVGYWECKRLEPGEKADVLIGWRTPQLIDLPIERKVSCLWLHDLNKGPGMGTVLSRWDRVLGVSAWHSNYLSQVYGLSNTSFVPNGINLDRFQNQTSKIPFRCVYGSSPDRGLALLLGLWPGILQVEPTAELHIAYGWETYDKTMLAIPQLRPRLEVEKAQIEILLKQVPNVIWRGRLNQTELAKLYQESYVWLYPTSFLEVSCITAMEAMAGGAVPVTSAAGALPETIGEAGIVVTGNTYSNPWREYWLACAKGALLSPDIRKPKMRAGLARVQNLTWDRSYEAHWKPLVESLLTREEFITV